MFPAKFEYHAPSSLDEAIKLLSSDGGDAKVLAGGHSLLPLMKLRLAQPGTLVDIGRIPGLSGIKVSGDAVTIGALTTHAELEASQELIPLLPPRTGTAYLKMDHPASHYALCGVAAVLTMGDGGTIADARVGITGVAPKAYRASGVEQALKGQPANADTFAKAAAHAADG